MVNRKRTILVASLFTCISLIATGFAAFVISITASGEVEGQFNVDVVRDESFTISDISDPNEINYCPVDSQHANDGYTWGNETWLQYKENENVEDRNLEVLTTKFTFKCTNASGLDATTPIKIELNELEADGTYAGGYYQAALQEGIVGELPTMDSSTITVQELSVDNNVGTYEATITFSWGSFFDGDNPIAFYSTKDSSAKRAGSSETFSQEALRILDSDAYKNLAVCLYNIKVTPVPKAA